MPHNKEARSGVGSGMGGETGRRKTSRNRDRPTDQSRQYNSTCSCAVDGKIGENRAPNRNPHSSVVNRITRHPSHRWLGPGDPASLCCTRVAPPTSTCTGTPRCPCHRRCNTPSCSRDRCTIHTLEWRRLSVSPSMCWYHPSTTPVLPKQSAQTLSAQAKASTVEHAY